MARTSSGASYPPQSINIRGSGGPYVIVVGNVAKGTTTEDIELTFEPFGPLEGVAERPPPSLNYPSLSFEVAFVRRDDANAACASLNGCLADGRVLSVAPRSTDLAPALNTFTNQTSAAARERLNAQGRIDPGPSPHPRNTVIDAPGKYSPLANQHSNPNAPAKGKKQPAPAPAKQPAAPAAEQPEPKSLSKRLGLGPSPAEKKAMALQKAAKAAKQGKITATPSLKSRIAIPLSERLGAPGQGVDPKKRAAFPAAKVAKKGKALAQAKAQAQAHAPGQGVSKAARKRAAKRAKAAGEGMDLD